MFLLLIILVSVFNVALTNNLGDIINTTIDINKNYFESDTVRAIREVWDGVRLPIEQALAKAMQETIGKDGLNVFTVKLSNLKLCDAYYHQQGRAAILLMNPYLTQLPNCWLPDAVLSLSSNVLKIETALTKMIIHADYLVLRNDSDIVGDQMELERQNRSPLLLREVFPRGKITLVVDGCTLSGSVIARLKGGTVNLGHAYFKLTKCQFNAEVYSEYFRGPPPVTFTYSDTKPEKSDTKTHHKQFLEIKDYLLKLLTDEFITKLQAMMLSYINTTAIFGDNLRVYEREQETFFLRMSKQNTKIMILHNKNMLELNGGTVDLPDFNSALYEARDNLTHLLPPPENHMRLSNLTLTGLETAYNSHTGGPYKLIKPMMIGQIRFNKIQVRGRVYLNEGDENELNKQFSAEISDFACNVKQEIRGRTTHWQLEIVGFRNIEVSPEKFMSFYNQNLLKGYLVDEVSKAIIEALLMASYRMGGEKLLEFPVTEE